MTLNSVSHALLVPAFIVNISGFGEISSCVSPVFWKLIYNRCLLSTIELLIWYHICYFQHFDRGQCHMRGLSFTSVANVVSLSWRACCELSIFRLQFLSLLIRSSRFKYGTPHCMTVWFTEDDTALWYIILLSCFYISVYFMPICIFVTCWSL